MASGGSFVVPANFDFLLTATALNGTWSGTRVVRGARDTVAETIILMRPFVTGGSDEAITLPFDQTRTAAVLRADRYRFQATAGQGVEIGISAPLSTLTGVLRVRTPAGAVLATAALSVRPATLQLLLPTAGEYTLEIEGTANAPGAYRLQATAKATLDRVSVSKLNDGEPSSYAKVAANANGAALAVWPEFTNNGTGALVASRYSSAAGWGAPQRITTSAGLYPSGLQVGLDDAGNASVSWDGASNPTVIRYAATTATWSAPQELASATCAGLGHRLSVSGQGAVHVVWGQNSSRGGLCTRYLAAGASTWSAEQNVATPLASANSDARETLSLSTQSSGSAVLTWAVRSPTVASTLYGMRFDVANATWGAPVELVAASGVAAASVAMGTDGGALLAWRTANQRLSAFWPAGQNTLVGNRVLADITLSENAIDPIALWRGTSNYMALWQLKGAGVNNGVKSATYASNTAVWSATKNLGTTGLSDSVLVAASANSAGNVMAVWQNVTALFNAKLLLGFSRFVPATESWTDSPTPISKEFVFVGSNSVNYADTISTSFNGGEITMVWKDLISATNTQTVIGSRLPALP